MRTVLAPAVLVLALAGSPVGYGAPQQPAATAADGRPSIAKFMKIRAPGMPTLAEDGSLYVRDWPDGINQLYRIPAADVGKAGAALPKSAAKLTGYKDGLAGYSLSPGGSRIILANAVGGNENTQVSHLDPKTGEITPLLQNPKAMFTPQGWFKDDGGFYYRANDTSPADFHLYRFEFVPGSAKGKSVKLMEREGSWNVSDATDDRARVLVSREISASQQEIYEMTPGKDGGEQRLRDFFCKNEDGSLAAADWVGYMPGAKSALLTSDHEKGIRRLFVRDLESGNLSKPLPDLDSFEIDQSSMNKERTLLAVATNEEGYGVLRVYRLPSFEPGKLPEIEKGVVGVASLRKNTIVWSQSNARTPGLSYAYQVPEAGKADAKLAARQLTFADTQGIDLGTFPPPKLIKYKSFDGLEVPAFLWAPPGFKEGTPIPFVANFHGGPEGQFRPQFDRTTQYLLSRGFGVIQPNVRGSTGYGREYQMKDDYKNRWASVKDGVEAARWLTKNGYAKPGKIAAYGGSYGGFMSVATIVEDGGSKEPVFGASVNVVGIVNMKTFLEQTSGYRRKLREVEYGPLTDPDFLKTISPLEQIDKIKVPMLIAHGANDPRVPVGEAMQLAIGLIKRGHDPVQLYFPDEGHGFQKLENRLVFAEHMAKFLDKTIGK